jgi:hypothetical protein
MLCSCFFSYSYSASRYSYSYSMRSSIAIRPIDPQVVANCLDQRSASPRFKQPSSTSTVSLSTASLSTSTTKSDARARSTISTRLTDQIKSGRCPWLSPSFSRSTSIRSSNDNHKLLIGVSLGNTMCLPVLSVPEPPPATRMGKSS